jgi:hypothetical protein
MIVTKLAERVRDSRRFVAVAARYGKLTSRLWSMALHNQP